MSLRLGSRLGIITINGQEYKWNKLENGLVLKDDVQHGKAWEREKDDLWNGNGQEMENKTNA